MVDRPDASLAEVTATDGPFLFLSPHLDDAVLSCGALMRWLASSRPVEVVTAFTAAGPPPHTYAARSFLRTCATPDAGALFARRRAEDRAVLDRLGVTHAHLGYPDALFRRRAGGTALGRRAGRILPELVHRYPTYRFDIAKGRIARGDRTLIAEVTAAVRDRVRQTGARWLFCPLGVGRHADHLIARAAGERFPDRVVYYADFPYIRWAAPDPEFLARHGLVRSSWTAGIGAKEELIRGYGTQVGSMFPDGRIPTAPESYYRPPS